MEISSQISSLFVWSNRSFVFDRGQTIVSKIDESKLDSVFEEKNLGDGANNFGDFVFVDWENLGNEQDCLGF